MIIVGLNHGEINSSAAIYKDGKVIAGSSEERFTRKKKTKDFPYQSLKFCLETCQISIDDVDCVAQSWNPGASWIKYNPLLSEFRSKREDYFYTIPDHLFRFKDRELDDYVIMEIPNLPSLYYIQHHRAHAANAFYLSEFEHAAFLTSDWKGEFETTTMGFGKGGKIELLNKQEMPNSLGIFYTTFTELLGYRPDNDEWKVMALSAYDIDSQKMEKAIKQTYSLKEDGSLFLDINYYKGAFLDQPNLYTNSLVELLGGKVGAKGEEPNEWHYSVAKAMQSIAEEIVYAKLKHLHKITRIPNLVLGGGFFMNCVVNGKVIENTPFEKVFISHSPADVGNSLGAALYVAHHLKNDPREIRYNSSYIGSKFTDKECEQALIKRGIPYEKITDVPQVVAQILSKGEIVAHFDGRAEFGERALGNRSILANPMIVGMKDKINSIIKYRESYRPFAPVAKQEIASKYFEVESDYQCAYMEKVVNVRPEYQTIIPEVTHFDCSARLQTVTEEQNVKLYKILTEFETISGIGLLINTSFNINGEPIVNSPEDAISTFYNSGLKYLILGNYLIVKTKI